jgi:hypothetical protein
MDYFEKRKLFNRAFKDLMAQVGVTPEKTNFNPYFMISEHHTLDEPVSTSKLTQEVEYLELFEPSIKKIKAKTFINKIKKIILKYSRLLNLDIIFFDAPPSLEIELNLDYKNFFDIDNVGFVIRGAGDKIGFTAFRCFVHLNHVTPTYEITQLDGKLPENPTFIDLHVHYKKADDIIIPLLNAYKDTVSQLVGYEVTEVDQDIITVLDMLKI